MRLETLLLNRERVQTHHSRATWRIEPPNSRKRIRLSFRSLFLPRCLFLAAWLLSLPGISAAQSLNITEYVVPNAGNLSGIVTGSDGALWFTKGGSANRIGRMYYNDGVGFTEYAVPTAASNPFGITSDPNGPLWFTENSGNKIGRITTAGTITEFQIPTANSGPWGIAYSGNGIWFTENTGNKIGRITPTGSITEFPIPTANSGPRGIVWGPDGAMWFTEANGNKIGRITASGVITEFPIPTPNSLPSAITSYDGDVWFTEANGNKIGRITTTSPITITEFPIPTPGSAPSDITPGGDCDALWFTEQSGNKIGRMDLGYNCGAGTDGALGDIREFSVPTLNSGPRSITLAKDGALWFTELLAGKIGRFSVIITTEILPKGALNKPYSYPLRAQGGQFPYRWSATGLPPGLTMNSVGVLSGSPTTLGAFKPNITVTDSSSPAQTTEKTIDLTVDPPLTITTSSLPAGVLGVSFTVFPGTTTLQAQNGQIPYSWTATGLPPGMTLSSTGSLGGTPSALGTFNVNATVTDFSIPQQTATRVIPLQITNPVTFTPATLPNGQVNVPYPNVTFQGQGGISPYSFVVPPVGLPPGLSMTAAGVLSGTPTTAGTFSMNVSIGDSNTPQQAASRMYSVTIAPALALSCSTSAGPSTAGVTYTATCNVAGGTAPYNWSINPGSLPTGLTLNATGTSATVSGTPTVPGPYSYSVRVTDSATTPQARTQAYAGTIIPALALNCNPTTGPSTVGLAYTATCNLTGGTAPYTWSINPGSLPAGLTLNSTGTSATVNGTPTAPGPYSYTVQVTDGGQTPQSRTQVYSGTITTAVLNCSLTTGPSTVGIPYTATCNVTGGTPPYSWSISPGSLPTGLTLNSTGTSATVSGAATSPGPYSYSVQVTDSGTTRQSRIQAYSGTIATLTLSCDPRTGPSIVGIAYTANCNVTGGNAPYSWSISPGSLPTGLTLNSSGPTATVSGKATAQGPYSFSLRVVDASSPQRMATQTYTGTINPLPIPTMNITVEPTPIPTDSAPFGIQLSDAAPVTLKGTLSLSFRASPAGLAGATSPTNPQFTSGGNTLNFEIPAGASSAALQNATINQGIVAGDITLSLTQLSADSVDVTPTASVNRTITVPNLPPVIVPNSVRFMNVTTNGFQVELTGYSTPRDLVQARYTFEVASGTRVEGSATIDVDLASAATQWFGNVEQSYAKYGSSFLLRMQFTVEGKASLITAVTVSLRNSVGSSTQVTARR